MKFKNEEKLTDAERVKLYEIRKSYKKELSPIEERIHNMTKEEIVFDPDLAVQTGAEFKNCLNKYIGILSDAGLEHFIDLDPTGFIYKSTYEYDEDDNIIESSRPTLHTAFEEDHKFMLFDALMGSINPLLFYKR